MKLPIEKSTLVHEDCGYTFMINAKQIKAKGIRTFIFVLLAMMVVLMLQITGRMQDNLLANI